MNNENSFWQRIKDRFRKINLKSMLKVISVIVVLTLIIVTSVIHAGFDPEKFNFYDWLSKALMIIAISIFGILMGESIGEDKQKSSPNGLYQKCLSEFADIHEQVQIIALYFGDFLVWLRQKEVVRRKVNLLLDNGIPEAKDIVDKLEIEKVKELLDHPILLDNDKIIRKKTQEQIDIILYVLSDKVTVQSNSSDYYLNVFSNGKSKSELETGFKIDKEKRINQGVRRTVKITWFIVFSILIAGVSVKEFMDVSDGSAWLDLVSRIMALCTSLFSGYTTGVVDVKLDSKKIANKTSILRMFKISYDTKEFLPSTYEDLARQEYEEYIKSKNPPIEIKEKSIDVND